MPVVCFNHREEIESAIQHYRLSLVVTDKSGRNDGATELWDPRWHNERAFSDRAHEIGLDLCSYYPDEHQANFAANEFVLHRELVDHVRGSLEDSTLTYSLTCHSIKLLSFGFISFHQFSNRIATIASEALSGEAIGNEGGKRTSEFVSAQTQHLYTSAALSEYLDDRVARMCDPIWLIREAPIPNAYQQQKALPSWDGMIFD